MIRCACPAASLTSLRFTDGVVMHRCVTHEQHAWSLDGRDAERHEVLPVLKGLFLDHRGERSADRGTPRTRPSTPQAPVACAAPVRCTAAVDDGDRLTALLRARGLSGTWAVA